MCVDKERELIIWYTAKADPWGGGGMANQPPFMCCTICFIVSASIHYCNRGRTHLF